MSAENMEPICLRLKEDMMSWISLPDNWVADPVVWAFPRAVTCMWCIISLQPLGLIVITHQRKDLMLLWSVWHRYLRCITLNWSHTYQYVGTIQSVFFTSKTCVLYVASIGHMTFSLYLGDSSVMACVGQNMFSSLTVVVDCFLSSRNSRRRFKISSLFCAYLSLSLRLLTSLGSAYRADFSIPP